MVGPLAALRERPEWEAIPLPISARSIVAITIRRRPPIRAAGVELGIWLLVDYREPLIPMRTALCNDLHWHLHDCGPSRAFPGVRWPTAVSGDLVEDHVDGGSSRWAQRLQAAAADDDATPAGASRPWRMADWPGVMECGEHHWWRADGSASFVAATVHRRRRPLSAPICSA
jgi:hypothetical protein